MTLYADILLAVNCIMNSVILWVVAKLTRRKIKLPRIIAGGLVMALLHGILLFTAAVSVHPLIASVFILAAGVAISLRPNKFRSFFTMMALAYIASFTVGGIGMGLFYLTDLPYAVHIISTDLTGFSRSLPWYLPVVCVFFVYILIKLGLHVVERITLKRQTLCPVQVFMGEDTAHFDALIDTGHSLQEPISKSPVIIAEFEQIKIFLPDNLKVAFFENRENNWQSFLHKQHSPFDKRLRMIPFTSVGSQHGMLIGFRPDKVRVGEAEPVSEVVIGIYNNRLTSDGRYQGLLSPELIK